MHGCRRQPRFLLGLAPLALLAGCVAAERLAPRSGLGPEGETVTILRDEFGVPNIFAATAEGACFAAGYAQAEDRPEELYLQYRRALGTYAEVRGRERLSSDWRVRLWGHARIARERWGQVSERSRALIEAYVEGIERYFRERPDRRPAQAFPLEPWMVVALGRQVIWGWLEAEGAADLARAGVRLQGPEPRGSNQWVVSGKRTASGAPMALVDPHLSWYGIFRFYEARLYGGELAVAGVGILGTPLPSLGHSRFASVAMTTGGPDCVDVFEVTLDPERPGAYLHDGEWKDLHVRQETIRVLEDGRLRDEVHEFRFTHHGPIVAEKGAKAYAMYNPYLEEVGLLDQIYDMMTAPDLRAMKKALARFQLMQQNVMVATVDGDLYYLRSGRVPVRPEGVDPGRPLPGDSSRSEPRGIHPLADLVQIENPPQGYMQNCNVSPAVMMVDSPLTRERYARRPYLFNEERPYLHQRAAQTHKELHQETRLTVERAVEIAHSTVVFGAEVWQERLRAAGAEGLDPDAARLRELILAWDRRADEGSSGAVAYLFWKERVHAVPGEVPVDPRFAEASSLGEAAQIADRAGLDPPDIPAPALRTCLAEGASKLKTDWGSLEVPWGRIFRIQREGSPRSFPVAGGNLYGMGTPRAVGYRAGPEGKTRIAHSGQTATQVVHLTRPPESWSLLPLGESDDPASPHFDDQAEKLMQRRLLKPSRFLRPDQLLPHVTARKELLRPVKR